MIVDTHVHVVADDRDRYPLSPGVSTNPWYETHPCPAPRLRELMAGAGVDAAVLVQGVGAYGFDNAYALDAAAAAPGVFSAVVCTDRRAADAATRITDLVRARGARGYRWFTVHDDPTLDQPELWDHLERLGIPVVVTVLADRLPEVAAIAATRPGLALALDHCGFADLGRGVPDDLADLAAFPNVWCKVSTHALHTAAAAGDPADAVAELAARFPGRTMWGSDYSQTHHAPYADIVDEGRRAAAKLADAARDSFLAGAALALWPELGRGLPAGAGTR